MLLLIVIVTLVIVCVFLVVTKRYHANKIDHIVKEKFSNSVIPEVMVIQHYNEGLDNIQNQFIDQMDAINYIKRSTYDKKLVNDLVGNLKTEIDNTQNIMNNDMGVVKKDMNNKASRDHVDAFYAKKEDVAKTLTEYARQQQIDAEISKLNTDVRDTYLPKNIANLTFANKSDVIILNEGVVGLEAKQELLDNEINSINDTLPSYMTRGDLASYARYTDFVDLDSKLSSNNRDMSRNYQTVSDFIGVQSDINKTFLDNDIVLQSDILQMKNKHDDLVNDLGNYMSTDAIQNLLQNSYTPVAKFNVLEKDVNELHTTVENIDLRTRNNETNLRIMDSQLCLNDPVSKNNVCLMGGDFALLKDIMNEYYADQAQDSDRLKKLEESRKQSEQNIINLNNELRISEAKREQVELENRLAREKLMEDAILKDTELNNNLTNAIYKVQTSTTMETQRLKEALALEQQKLDIEMGNMTKLNSQLANLTTKLTKVETQDMVQDSTIRDLTAKVEGFQVEKKKLQDTITDKKKDIKELEGTVSSESVTIQLQRDKIVQQEGDLNNCISERNTCNASHNICVGDLNLAKIKINDQANQVANEVRNCSFSQNKYSELESDYDNVLEQCFSKITQEECDYQERRVHKLALFNKDKHIFDADIIARYNIDDVKQGEILEIEKDKKVYEMTQLFKDQGVSLYNYMTEYPNQKVYRWGEVSN